MKKQYFLMAAFATAMAFTACSNEDEMPAVDNGNGTLGLDEDYIEIAISNTGTGTTRTARPVGSSAADNNVNRVQLVFLNEQGEKVSIDDDGENTLKITLAEGESGYSITDGLISYNTADDNEGVPGDTDREKKKAKLKVSGLTANAKYTIIAYGYNDNFPYGTPTLESGQTYFKTGTHNLSGFNLEEVFAASTTAQVTGNLGTAEAPVYKFNSSVRIELTRQVAGMLAYFKNVPAYISDTQVDKITVEANSKSDGFYFPGQLYSSDNGLNGIAATGFTAGTDTDVLLTFSGLSDCQTTDYNGGKIYTFAAAGEGDNTGKNYKLADDMPTNASLVCEDNTLFGGRFILPYSAHADQPTGSTTLVVKFWSKAEGQGQPTLLSTRLVRTQNTSTADKAYYDILRNNFYSIGKKLATDGTDGGDEEDDDDEPIDLSSTDELIVLINDAWDVIHDMVVE